MTPLDRLLGRCAVTTDGCVVWAGAQNSRGYGVIGVNGKRVLTHRLSYEMQVGFLAEDITIDHLCCNKLCVNPAHLEPVSHHENRRRAAFGTLWRPVARPFWLTLGEVEQAAQKSRRDVLAALADGSLRGTQLKVGGKWRVHRDDVDAWLRGEPAPARASSYTRRAS